MISIVRHLSLMLCSLKTGEKSINSQWFGTSHSYPHPIPESYPYTAPRPKRSLLLMTCLPLRLHKKGFSWLRWLFLCFKIKIENIIWRKTTKNGYLEIFFFFLKSKELQLGISFGKQRKGKRYEWGEEKWSQNPYSQSHKWIWAFAE